MNTDSLLNVESAVDRVLDESSAKSFVFNADVFRFNDEKYFGVNLVYENPLPVCNDSGVKIGGVVLGLLNDVLVGKFYIDYSTPERFNIETKTVPMYPALDFYCDKIIENHETRMSSMYISGVILGIMPPEGNGNVGQI